MSDEVGDATARALGSPLEVVQGLFEQSAAAAGSAGSYRGDWSVPGHFEELLFRRGHIRAVPFVTRESVSQGKLRPNSLVRYRGLVQDMFDPEFYVGVFQSQSTVDGEKQTRHSRYMDMAPAGMDGAAGAGAFDPERTFQRKPLYCVPIPGEQEWVRRKLDPAPPAAAAAASSSSSSSSSVRGKRGLDAKEPAGDDECCTTSSSSSSSVPAPPTEGVLAASIAAPADAASNKRRLVEPSECNGQAMEEEEVAGAASGKVKSGGGGRDGGGQKCELNMPLGDDVEEECACIVSIYGDPDADAPLKLNQIVEFVGVLAVDPVAGVAQDEETRETSAAAAGAGAGASAAGASASASGSLGNGGHFDLFTENVEERRAHSPPGSLVPRLHCITYRVLSQTYPFLPPVQVETRTETQAAETPPQTSEAEEAGTAAGAEGGPSRAAGGDDMAALVHLLELRMAGGQEACAAAWGAPPTGGGGTNATAVRENLLAYLAQALGGDRLAAEFALLALVSGVRTRRGTQPIGSFALNLSFPQEREGEGEGATGEGSTATLAGRVDAAVRAVLGSVASLELSLAALDKQNYSPKKDYAKNRLSAGPLQLADGTTLLVDETTLRPGKLAATGVGNVQALQKLALFQTVTYDFEYHNVDFPVDISMIVLSSGKSILDDGCLSRVPVRRPGTDSEAGAAEADAGAGSAAVGAPSDECLEQFRLLLMAARVAPRFYIGDAMAKQMEQDFVSARQRDAKVSGETFHTWVTMARLLSATHLEDSLLPDRWARVMEMEAARVARVAKVTTEQSAEVAAAGKKTGSAAAAAAATPMQEETTTTATTATGKRVMSTA